MAETPQRNPRRALRAASQPSPVGTEAFLLIVISLADLLLTYRLLSHGGPFYEGNPIAEWVFRRWNVTGLVAFKFGLVAVVVALGEAIERARPRAGRAVLLFGAAAAGFAFVQGLRLWLEHG